VACIVRFLEKACARVLCPGFSPLRAWLLTPVACAASAKRVRAGEFIADSVITQVCRWIR